MQMIMIPEERYNRMVESYDRAQKELRELREQLAAVGVSCDDVARELKLYDVMDDLGCDRDEAELLLQDEEESIAISQQGEEGNADGE
ncbi:hypothetical protein AAAV70_07360 [Hungatella hathewayi]|uniref:hypothetical protein n=1 Tax=Hungatella hathewayi TaxID=154046 RepID=UPI0026DBC479|nr:hypothetical protein [Hungatella hathewayi]